MLTPFLLCLSALTHAAASDAPDAAVIFTKSRALLSTLYAWRYEEEIPGGARKLLVKTTALQIADGILKRVDYIEFVIRRQTGKPSTVVLWPGSRYIYLYFPSGIWILYPEVNTAVAFPTRGTNLPIQDADLAMPPPGKPSILADLLLPQCGNIDHTITERDIGGTTCYAVTLQLSPDEVRRRQTILSSAAANSGSKTPRPPAAIVYFIAKSDFTPRGEQLFSEDGTILSEQIFKSFDPAPIVSANDFSIPDTYTEFHPRSMEILQEVKATIMNRQRNAIQSPTP